MSTDVRTWGSSPNPHSCRLRSSLTSRLSGTTHLFRVAPNGATRTSRRSERAAAAFHPSHSGLPAVARRASEGGTPGSKYAGGHRIRVTPVPIPNTEVKPDTADGTARETVWESRSLPALSQGARELRFAGFRLYGRAVAHSFPCGTGSVSLGRLAPLGGGGVSGYFAGGFAAVPGCPRRPRITTPASSFL